jgi:chloramphenicol-sensitive protein RarD
MRKGVTLGIAAYVAWGLLPVYWKAVEVVPTLEILSHRFVWSFVFVSGVLALRRRWNWLRGLGRRSLVMLFGAGALLALNWGTYIWAVNDGRIVETALGYFINPLFNVVLGVAVLHERLRRLQWTAIGIAAAGVGYMTVRLGTVPWVAFTLALTFGLYGLVTKKVRGVGPLQSLTVETALLFIPAVVYLTTLQVRGDAAFGGDGLRVTVLLALTGVATATPLLLFNAAARRIPLSLVGLLQYIAPSIAFVLGITVYGEVVGTDRLIGFLCVWAALALYTAEGLSHRRRQPTLDVVAPA